MPEAAPVTMAVLPEISIHEAPFISGLFRWIVLREPIRISAKPNCSTCLMRWRASAGEQRYRPAKLMALKEIAVTVIRGPQEGH